MSKKSRKSQRNDPPFPSAEIVPKRMTEEKINEKRVWKVRLPMTGPFTRRYVLDGMMGNGSYGQVYLVMDNKKGEERAMKVEPVKRNGQIAKRMIVEMAVLLKLQHCKHIPIVYETGYHMERNFIVMELLTRNLGDLKKCSPAGRFSKETSGRIAYQWFEGLREIHNEGIVHRDIKPANVCFGAHRHNRYNLYMVDFGLCRRFRKPNGEWREPRTRAGFKGTERYVSVRVHARMEQTPWDDVCAVFYSCYELLVGELPWKFIDDGLNMTVLKMNMHNFRLNNEMFKGVGWCFADVLKAIEKADPLAEFPYESVLEPLKAVFEPKTLRDPYDWENDYSTVEHLPPW